jgi:hypothetical protein
MDWKSQLISALLQIKTCKVKAFCCDTVLKSRSIEKCSFLKQVHMQYVHTLEHLFIDSHEAGVANTSTVYS